MKGALTDTALARRRLVIALVAVSTLPAALTLLGLDLASPAPRWDLLGTEPQDSIAEVMSALSGSYVHALMEWSAVCVATITVVFAWLNHRITGDRLATILGLALFTAGLMDAFHTLAAAQLIPRSDPVDFTPFTWALSRLMNALLLIGGSLLALSPRVAGPEQRSGSVAWAAAIFGSIAAVSILVSTAVPDLPPTMYPDAVIMRPWDVVPGILFLLAGLLVFPRLHRRFDSTFSLALWASAVPNGMAQLHMAFGSERLFDHHFHVGHFLKLVAYAVPLGGLLMDYGRAYARANRAEELEQANLALKRSQAALAASNSELERFAYIASHDLREPLRKIQAFSGRLSKRLGSDLDERSADYMARMEGAVARMRQLIDDLLLLSRVNRSDIKLTQVPLDLVVAAVVVDIGQRLDEVHGRIEVGPLPTLEGDRTQMRQLFQNLLANSLKFRREGVEPVVRVSAESASVDGVPVGVITIEDNGVGFEDKDAASLFEAFRRLHGRSEYEGTGIGLSVVASIVARHNGKVEARGRPGEGATFVVTLPLQQPRDVVAPAG